MPEDAALTRLARRTMKSGEPGPTGTRMRSMFDPSVSTQLDEYDRRRLTPQFREDEVEMPGGGARSIDDLEAAGMMTDALRAKARPSVFAAMREQSPVDVARARLAMMGAAQDAGGPRAVAAARRAREQRNAEIILGKEMRERDPNVTPGQIRGAAEWQRREPLRFAEEFYSTPQETYARESRRQAEQEQVRRMLAEEAMASRDAAEALTERRATGELLPTDPLMPAEADAEMERGVRRRVEAEALRQQYGAPLPRTVRR
jgi:hypothetical protein